MANVDSNGPVHMLKYHDQSIYSHKMSDYQFRIIDMGLPTHMNPVPLNFGKGKSKRTVEREDKPDTGKSMPDSSGPARAFPCKLCGALFSSRAQVTAHNKKRECIPKPPQPHEEIVGEKISVYWQNAHGRYKGEWYDAEVLAYVREERDGEIHKLHHLKYDDESCWWSPLSEFEWVLVKPASSEDGAERLTAKELNEKNKTGEFVVQQKKRKKTEDGDGSKAKKKVKKKQGKSQGKETLKENLSAPASSQEKLSEDKDPVREQMLLQKRKAEAARKAAIKAKEEERKIQEAKIAYEKEMHALQTLGAPKEVHSTGIQSEQKTQKLIDSFLNEANSPKKQKKTPSPKATPKSKESPKSKKIGPKKGVQATANPTGPKPSKKSPFDFFAPVHAAKKVKDYVSGYAGLPGM